jgi:hypothetical protein
VVRTATLPNSIALRQVSHSNIERVTYVASYTRTHRRGQAIAHCRSGVSHLNQADQGDNVTFKERGNARAYVLARLDRDRPEARRAPEPRSDLRIYEYTPFSIGAGWCQALSDCSVPSI